MTQAAGFQQSASGGVGLKPADGGRGWNKYGAQCCLHLHLQFHTTHTLSYQSHYTSSIHPQVLQGGALGWSLQMVDGAAGQKDHFCLPESSHA